MEASHESFPLHSLPKDIWNILLSCLGVYDTIFLRATSRWLYKLSKELHPFPKHFVLDQNECMAYLIKNGFISCLDYVKTSLNFEWTEEQCAAAARSGQLDTLKFLREHGCPFNANTVLLECTKGTCDVHMIAYLHESGVAWDQQDPTVKLRPGFQYNFYERDNTAQTVLENMAFKGHVTCIQYALQHDCQQRQVYYTPSTACLDYLIAQQVDWHGEEGAVVLGRLGKTRPVKLSFCEEAAKRGNFTVLKYAVEKGAPLHQSAVFAADAGHLQVLKYVLEHPNYQGGIPKSAKTLECLQYLLAKYGNQNALESDFDNSFKWRSVVINSAEHLQLLIDHDFPVPSPTENEHILTAATHSAATLKFMLDVAKFRFVETDPYAECALRGNLEGLQLVFERNLPLKQSSGEPAVQNIMKNAIRSKNLAVVKFVWENFPSKESNFDSMVSNIAQSTPEILEFLTAQGVRWTSKHLAAAAEARKLPNLAYLTRVGCRWEGEPCASSHAMCLKYAREHGCTEFDNKYIVWL